MCVGALNIWVYTPFYPDDALIYRDTAPKSCNNSPNNPDIALICREDAPNKCLNAGFDCESAPDSPNRETRADHFFRIIENIQGLEKFFLIIWL